MLRFVWILIMVAGSSLTHGAIAQDATTPAETVTEQTEAPAEPSSPAESAPSSPEQTNDEAMPANEPAEGEAGVTEPNPQSVLSEILSGQMLANEMFTPEFLGAVPLAEAERIVTQTRQTIGPIETIAPTRSGFKVTTATHEMQAEIQLDAQGRISGLFFHPPVEIGRDLDQLLSEIASLGGGEVSYLITRDGQAQKSLNPDKPLAVGSAFKLGVLAALLDRVKAGEARWTDIASLEARQVSLPTGILQTFPIGAPLTLHTLAALMISISDNTATDILIDRVGRQAVAEKLGTGFVLKTREMFMLKGDEALAKRFLAADIEGKQQVAAELDSRQISAQGANKPHIAGIEWYVPASRLCQLVDAVSGLDVMSISPGPVDADTWQRVAFKGGSEGGVLNLTASVTNENGTRYCVTVTWNAPQALDEGKAAGLYASLLRTLSAQ